MPKRRAQWREGAKCEARRADCLPNQGEMKPRGDKNPVTESACDYRNETPRERGLRSRKFLSAGE